MNGYIKVPVKVVSAIKIHSQKTVREGKKKWQYKNREVQITHICYYSTYKSDPKHDLFNSEGSILVAPLQLLEYPSYYL